MQNNKRKRSKSKQHQGSKDAKDKAERPEVGPLQPQVPLMQNGHVNGCDKDSSSPDSAGEKLALPPRERKISILEEPPRALRGTTGQLFLSMFAESTTCMHAEVNALTLWWRLLLLLLHRMRNSELLVCRCQ